MARTKQDNEYTRASAQFDKDSEAYDKLAAKAAHEKATPADKKAADDAKTALAEKAKTLKRLRFKTIGSTRVGKALAAIELLGNISNRRQYDFSADDVAKITDALNARVAQVSKQFAEALTAAPIATVATKKFSFD